MGKATTQWGGTLYVLTQLKGSMSLEKMEGEHEQAGAEIDKLATGINCGKGRNFFPSIEDGIPTALQVLNYVDFERVTARPRIRAIGLSMILY